MAFPQTFAQAKAESDERLARAHGRLASMRLNGRVIDPPFISSAAFGRDDQLDAFQYAIAASQPPQTANLGSMRYDVQTDSWSSGATIWGRPGEIESRDTEQLRAVQAEVDEQWAEAEARWAFEEQSRSERMRWVAEVMFEERLRLSITDPRSIIFTSMS